MKQVLGLIGLVAATVVCSGAFAKDVRGPKTSINLAQVTMKGGARTQEPATKGWGNQSTSLGLDKDTRRLSAR